MVVDMAAIRARVVEIGLALVSLAVQRAMEKPEIQQAILDRVQANIEETILSALESIPPEENSGEAPATGSA